MKVEVGNIVTVIKEEYERFFDLQGYIVKIRRSSDQDKDGPIGVRFPSWNEYLFNYPDTSDTIVWFEEIDLRVDNCFVPLTQIKEVEYILGQVNVSSYLKVSLIPGVTDCMCEGCDKKAYFSILFNIWGSASQAYVCGDHASYHGMRMDDFPWKEGESGKELEKDEILTPLTLSQQAELLFPDFKGLIRTPIMPLVSGDTDCMCKGCNRKAYFSILVDNGDDVSVLYVCGDHASYHGKYMDDFLRKKIGFGLEMRKAG